MVTRGGAVTDVLVAGGVFREVLVAEDLRADEGLQRQVRMGGSGLYGAVAAARLGASVTLVAPVGRDDADLVETLCREAGVASALLVTPGASGTFAMARAAGAQPRPQYRPADGRVGAGDDVRSLHAALVLAFGHPEWDPLRSPIVANAVRDATLVWDPQGWLSRTPEAERVGGLPAHQRLVVANAEEVERWVARLPAGFEAAIVKDGPWGVHCYERDRRVVAIPAYDVEVRQTVGSGDVFAGCLAAGLALGLELAAACARAAAGAAAWIASDASLPGPEFSAEVATIAPAARRAPVVPERVRDEAAVVSVGQTLGSSALARVVEDVLIDLGVRVHSREEGSPATGVVVELRGRTCHVTGSEPGGMSEFRARALAFVTEALASAPGA